MYNLVATFAFPHDYWQDMPENHRHHTLPRPEIRAVSKDSDDVRGPNHRSTRIYKKKTQLLPLSSLIIRHDQVMSLNFNTFPCLARLANNVAKDGHNDSPSMTNLFF